MTETNLERLYCELAALNGKLDKVIELLTERGMRTLEELCPDDLVDADYFSRVTGLSPITIKQGKAGTDAVPLASKRPRRWFKRDVDRFVRERAQRLAPPKRKALKLLDRRGGRKGR
jgi:hypothetical protein